MNPIQLRLPQGAVQKGHLFRDSSLAELDQDILEIDLPSGLTIAVGWHPECDPDGKFHIVVFSRYWSNQIVEPITTNSVGEVATCLEA